MPEQKINQKKQLVQSQNPWSQSGRYKKSKVKRICGTSKVQ